jgi:hypothetical protein
MRIVTYKCEDGHEFKKLYSPGEKIDFELPCDYCQKRAIRQYNNINSSIEDDNITAAKEIMKFSTLPSGKDKKVY